VYVKGKGMVKGEMLVMLTKGLGAQLLNPATVVTGQTQFASYNLWKKRLVVNTM